MNLKPVMTTTEVANILKVTNNTVSTWFDKGLIDGYRNPGASTRRIPENAFSEFVKTHKIPIARLQKEKFFYKKKKPLVKKASFINIILLN